jgi:hypothetical protein
MKRSNLWVTVMLLVLAPVCAAQGFEFFPGVKYDPAIPTLKQVVGHDWGERVTMHHEIERYIHALAKATPRVRVVKYAETWEGRALYYVVVASEGNMARIEQVQAAMKQLADPRKTSDADAARIAASMPAVSWITSGVHGNEISSCDATLLAMYHLAAAQNDDLAHEVLEKSVVIFDPTQNPDGRDRFIQYSRMTERRGLPDGDSQAAEHNEPWPSGRVNHYLFDMNRDWFALTQPETRGRVAAFQQWYPVVFVDLHEMGGNSTYYFAPPAVPLNPHVPPFQAEWWKAYGKNNSQWFDKFRFDYFTREVFDSFYPGYGEGWPVFQGSIGMTYEQASTRGLAFDRSDQTRMLYRDTIQHHFIASLSTAQTTARNKEALLKYFYTYRKTAIEEGQKEAVKEYILAPGEDAGRAARFAAQLMAQGIEVKRATAAFNNARARDYGEGKVGPRDFPAGSYVISLAQPTKRLIKTLLDKHTPLDDAFIKEQMRRMTKRLGEEIYDVTGWSLPLLYGVEVYAAEVASAGPFTALSEAPAPHGRVVGGPAQLVYLMAWGTHGAARALADLQEQGVRTHMNDKHFVLNDVRFPAGSLAIKVKDNPADLHERLVRAAEKHGVTIHASDRAWIEEGSNLGSGNVHFLPKVRIALAWNQGTSQLSAGWTRYVLEQTYGLPVTVIHTQQIRGADLSKYNVLILPHGFGYGDALGEAGARRIRDWVQAGGTLVAYAGATRWLTEERVGLLNTTRELRGGRADREERPPAPAAGAAPPAAGAPAAPPSEVKPAPGEFDIEKHIQPDRESPEAVPGAILRVRLDTEHWLGFGYPAGEAHVMMEGDRIFTPIKLDRGTNVAVYLPADKVVASGLIWEGVRRQVGNKAFLIHQPMGQGHVVAFAEDPNYRAFMGGLNLLFLNSVFFGPAH